VDTPFVLKHGFKQERIERSESLRSLFRSSNDIGRKWPKELILDCLSMQGRAHRSLKRDLEFCGMDAASLKDVMSFVISDSREIPERRSDAMPACLKKDVGIKTFSYLIDHLSELDLGDAFNAEWQKRLKNLMGNLVKNNWHVPILLRRYL